MNFAFAKLSDFLRRFAAKLLSDGSFFVFAHGPVILSAVGVELYPQFLLPPLFSPRWQTLRRFRVLSGDCEGRVEKHAHVRLQAVPVLMRVQPVRMLVSLAPAWVVGLFFRRVFHS